MRISYHTPWPHPSAENLKVACDLDSALINEKELEKLIWETHWKIRVICRKDPDHCLPEQDEDTDLNMDLLMKILMNTLDSGHLFHELMCLVWPSKTYLTYGEANRHSSYSFKVSSLAWSHAW